MDHGQSQIMRRGAYAIQACKFAFGSFQLIFVFLAGPRETAKVSPVRKGMFFLADVGMHVECSGSERVPSARHKVHRSKSQSQQSPNCRQNLHLKALCALSSFTSSFTLVHMKNLKISHIPDFLYFVLQDLQVLQRGEVPR